MSAMSRMELGQTCVRDFQLDAAGGIGFDEIDESPGDWCGRNFLDEELQSGTGCEAAQEAANRATGTISIEVTALWYAGFRVQRRNRFGSSTSLTRTTLRPFDVDDLLIEQVTIKENNPSAPFAAGQSAGFVEV